MPVWCEMTLRRRRRKVSADASSPPQTNGRSTSGEWNFDRDMNQTKNETVICGKNAATQQGTGGSWLLRNAANVVWAELGFAHDAREGLLVQERCQRSSRTRDKRGRRRRSTIRRRTACEVRLAQEPVEGRGEAGENGVVIGLTAERVCREALHSRFEAPSAIPTVLLV